MFPNSYRRTATTVFATLLLAGMAVATPFTNGSFDSSAAGPTSFTGLGNGGLSAAADWKVWSNTPGSTTTTSLLASTDPLGSGSMIHVNTNGASNGLYQIFDAGNYSSSLDVYVLSGAVTFYLYNGASSISVTSTTQNTWETLFLPITAADELVIYSSTAGGAEFYADRASIPAGAAITASVPDTGSSLFCLAFVMPVVLSALRRAPRISN